MIEIEINQLFHIEIEMEKKWISYLLGKGCSEILLILLIFKIRLLYLDDEEEEENRKRYRDRDKREINTYSYHAL